MDKKIFKIVMGSLLASILLLVAAILFYVGAFREVPISEAEKGPLQLLYKKHLGPYHKISTTLDEVEKFARDNGAACDTTFGRYYDDPRVVAEDRLRADGGCIITGDLPQNTSGFETETLPARSYVVGEFLGAPSIGPLKVYPKIEDYVNEKGFKPDGPAIEIYKLLKNNGIQTTYLFPFKK